MSFSHLHIKNALGLYGETFAAHLLEEKGYTILERNCKIGPLEIDIIAENKEVVAFVEVRTRAYMFQGQTPEQSVNKDKQWHLSRAANAYVKMHRITKRVTLDVIGLIIDPRTKEVTYINHIQDAFNAPLRTVVPTRTFGGPRISLKKKKRHGF